MQVQAHIKWEDQEYQTDLSKPISLALPLRANASSVRAWGAPEVSIEPVQAGDWIGAVTAGAPVNFMNVCINPHGNATHTETLGHIAPNWASNTVLRLLPNAPLVANLRDVPTNASASGGRTVCFAALRDDPPNTPAVILRALGEHHEDQNFTGEDPPFFEAKDLAWLASLGVQHLITDLPSVDREEDGGALAAHHAWWQYPSSPRFNATITELARLNQHLSQGLYLLQLNPLPLAADASPCNPLIYPLHPRS